MATFQFPQDWSVLETVVSHHGGDLLDPALAVRLGGQMPQMRKNFDKLELDVVRSTLRSFGFQHYDDDATEARAMSLSSELVKRYHLLQLLHHVKYAKEGRERRLLKRGSARLDLCRSHFDEVQQVASQLLAEDGVGQRQFDARNWKATLTCTLDATEWPRILSVFRCIFPFAKGLHEKSSGDGRNQWTLLIEAAKNATSSEEMGLPCEPPALRVWDEELLNFVKDVRKGDVLRHILRVLGFVSAVAEFCVPRHVWILGPVPNPEYWGFRFGVEDVFKLFEPTLADAASTYELIRSGFGTAAPKEAILAFGQDEPTGLSDRRNRGFQLHAMLRSAYLSVLRGAKVLRNWRHAIKCLSPVEDSASAVTYEEKMLQTLNCMLFQAQRGIADWKWFMEYQRLSEEFPMCSGEPCENRVSKGRLYEQCRHVVEYLLKGNRPQLFVDLAISIIQDKAEEEGIEELSVRDTRFCALEERLFGRSILYNTFAADNTVPEVSKLLVAAADDGKITRPIVEAIGQIVERLDSSAKGGRLTWDFQRSDQERTAALPAMAFSGQATTVGGCVTDIGFPICNYRKTMRGGLLEFVKTDDVSVGDSLKKLIRQSMKEYETRTLRLEGGITLDQSLLSVRVHCHELGESDVRFTVYVDDEPITETNPVTCCEVADGRVPFLRIAQHVTGAPFRRRRIRIPDTAFMVAIACDANEELTSGRSYDVMNRVVYRISSELRFSFDRLSEHIRSEWSSRLVDGRTPLGSEVCNLLVDDAEDRAEDESMPWATRHRVIVIAPSEYDSIVRLLQEIKLSVTEVAIDQQSFVVQKHRLIEASRKPAASFAKITVAGQFTQQQAQQLCQVARSGSLRLIIEANPSTQCFADENPLITANAKRNFHPCEIGSYPHSIPFASCWADVLTVVEEIDLRSAAFTAARLAHNQLLEAVVSSETAALIMIVACRGSTLGADQLAIPENFQVCDLRVETNKRCALQNVLVTAAAGQYRRPVVALVDTVPLECTVLQVGEETIEARIVFLPSTNDSCRDAITMDSDVKLVVATVLDFHSAGELASVVEKSPMMSTLIDNLTRKIEAFRVESRGNQAFTYVPTFDVVCRDIPMFEWLDQRQAVRVFLQCVWGCDEEVVIAIVNGIRNVTSMSLATLLCDCTSVTCEFTTPHYQRLRVAGTITFPIAVRSSVESGRDLDWATCETEWRSSAPFTAPELMQVMLTYTKPLLLAHVLGATLFYTLKGTKLLVKDTLMPMRWSARIAKRLIDATALPWVSGVKSLSIMKWLMISLGWAIPPRISITATDFINIDDMHVVMDLVALQDCGARYEIARSLVELCGHCSPKLFLKQPRVLDLFYLPPDKGGLEYELGHRIIGDASCVGAPFLSVLLDAELGERTAVRQTSMVAELWKWFHRDEDVPAPSSAQELLGKLTVGARALLLASSASSSVRRRAQELQDSKHTLLQLVEAMLLLRDQVAFATDACMILLCEYPDQLRRLSSDGLHGLEHIQSALTTKNFAFCIDALRSSLHNEDWDQKVKDVELRFAMPLHLVGESGADSGIRALELAFANTLAIHNVNKSDHDDFFEIAVYAMLKCLTHSGRTHLSERLLDCSFGQQALDGTNLTKDDREVLAAALWVHVPLGPSALSLDSRLALQLVYGFMQRHSQHPSTLLGRLAGRCHKSVADDREVASYITLALVGIVEYLPLNIVNACVNELGILPRPCNIDQHATCISTQSINGSRFPSYVLQFHRRPLPPSQLEILFAENSYNLLDITKEMYDVSSGVSRAVIQKNLSYFARPVVDASPADDFYSLGIIVLWFQCLGLFGQQLEPANQHSSAHYTTTLASLVRSEVHKQRMTTSVARFVGYMGNNARLADFARASVCLPLPSCFDLRVLRRSALIQYFGCSSLDEVIYTYQMLMSSLQSLPPLTPVMDDDGPNDLPGCRRATHVEPPSKLVHNCTAMSELHWRVGRDCGVMLAHGAWKNTVPAKHLELAQSILTAPMTLIAAGFALEASEMVQCMVDSFLTQCADESARRTFVSTLILACGFLSELVRNELVAKICIMCTHLVTSDFPWNTRKLSAEDTHAVSRKNRGHTLVVFRTSLTKRVANEIRFFRSVAVCAGWPVDQDFVRDEDYDNDPIHNTDDTNNVANGLPAVSAVLLEQLQRCQAAHLGVSVADVADEQGEEAVDSITPLFKSCAVAEDAPRRGSAQAAAEGAPQSKSTVSKSLTAAPRPSLRQPSATIDVSGIVEIDALPESILACGTLRVGGGLTCHLVQDPDYDTYRVVAHIDVSHTDRIVHTFSDYGEAWDACLRHEHPSLILGRGFFLATTPGGGWRFHLGVSHYSIGTSQVRIWHVLAFIQTLQLVGNFRLFPGSSAEAVSNLLGWCCQMILKHKSVDEQLNNHGVRNGLPAHPQLSTQHALVLLFRLSAASLPPAAQEALEAANTCVIDFVSRILEGVGRLDSEQHSGPQFNGVVNGDRSFLEDLITRSRPDGLGACSVTIDDIDFLIDILLGCLGQTCDLRTLKNVVSFKLESTLTESDDCFRKLRPLCRAMETMRFFGHANNDPTKKLQSLHRAFVLAWKAQNQRGSSEPRVEMTDEENQFNNDEVPNMTEATLLESLLSDKRYGVPMGAVVLFEQQFDRLKKKSELCDVKSVEQWSKCMEGLNMANQPPPKQLVVHPAHIFRAEDVADWDGAVGHGIQTEVLETIRHCIPRDGLQESTLQLIIPERPSRFKSGDVGKVYGFFIDTRAFYLQEPDEPPLYWKSMQRLQDFHAKKLGAHLNDFHADELTAYAPELTEHGRWRMDELEVNNVSQDDINQRTDYFRKNFWRLKWFRDQFEKRSQAHLHRYVYALYDDGAEEANRLVDESEWKMREAYYRLRCDSEVNSDLLRRWIMQILLSPLPVKWKEWFFLHLHSNSVTRIGSENKSLLRIAQCLAQRCEIGSLRDIFLAAFDPPARYFQRKNRLYGLICMAEPNLDEWRSQQVGFVDIANVTAAGDTPEEQYQAIVSSFSDFTTHVVVRGLREIPDLFLKWCCEYTMRFSWRFIVLVGCDTRQNLPENRDRVWNWLPAELGVTRRRELVRHDRDTDSLSHFAIPTEISKSVRSCNWTSQVTTLLMDKSTRGGLVIHLETPPGGGKSTLMGSLIDQDPSIRFVWVDCSEDRLVEEALVFFINSKLQGVNLARDHVVLVADEYHMLPATKKHEFLDWVQHKIHQIKVIMIANRKDDIDNKTLTALRDRNVCRVETIEGRVSVSKIEEVIRNQYRKSRVEAAASVRRFATFLIAMRGLYSDSAVSLRLEPAFEKDPRKPINNPQYVELLQDKLVIFGPKAVARVLRHYEQISSVFDTSGAIDSEVVKLEFKDALGGSPTRLLVLTAMLVPLLLYQPPAEREIDQRCDRSMSVREVTAATAGLAKAPPAIRLAAWVVYTASYVGIELDSGEQKLLIDTLRRLEVVDLQDFPIIEGESNVRMASLAATMSLIEDHHDLTDLEWIKGRLINGVALPWSKIKSTWAVNPVTDAGALETVMAATNPDTVFEALSPGNTLQLLQKERSTFYDRVRTSYPESSVKREQSLYESPYFFTVWNSVVSAPPPAWRCDPLKILMDSLLRDSWKDWEERRQQAFVYDFLLWVSDNGDIVTAVPGDIELRTTLAVRSVIAGLDFALPATEPGRIEKLTQIWRGKYLARVAWLATARDDDGRRLMPLADAYAVATQAPIAHDKWPTTMKLLWEVGHRFRATFSLEKSMILLSVVRVLDDDVPPPHQLVLALLYTDPHGYLPPAVQMKIIGLGMPINHELSNSYGSNTQLHPERNVQLVLRRRDMTMDQVRVDEQSNFGRKIREILAQQGTD